MNTSTFPLAEITPTQFLRIMDMVRDAGVDVSDWGNFKGGLSRAASNPKYCYEWSFVEPGKVVVINLWLESMRTLDGTLVQEHNLRKEAGRYELLPGKSVWAKRARTMDEAIQTAVREGLPIRVVVCDGERRNSDETSAKASSVQRRLLDPVLWAVTSYSWNTGDCILTRGATPARYVDQFSIERGQRDLPERRAVTGYVYERSVEVRKRVLIRSKGVCEWCGHTGFVAADGSLFLETHHVVPLAEGGRDTESNVVALCPNHHREAHHGAKGEEMRTMMLSSLSSGNAEQTHPPGDVGRLEMEHSAMFYSCFSCHKVMPLIGTTEKKCPSCGSANGEVLANERFQEGFKAGTYYNIDPKTGKRAKTKRR